MIRGFFVALGLLALAGMSAAQTIDFEDQQIPPGWSQSSGSNASWIITGDDAFSGNYSLRSAPLVAGVASIEWTAEFPAATLSFVYWRRPEACCSRLNVWIDGQQVMSSYFGTGAWEEFRTALSAGNHTIRWEFYPDGFTPDASALIDFIRVGNDLPVAQPLLQQPGAVIASTYLSLVESRFMQPGRVAHPSQVDGNLAITPARTLYVNTPNTQTLSRYEPVRNQFATVGQNIRMTQAFASLPDRLIGGRVNGCGAYSLVFHATGNVFNSPAPQPCEVDWSALAIAGSNLHVLQGNRVSRRNVAAPGSVISAFELPTWGSGLGVDPDGSLWVAGHGTLSRYSPAGALLDEYGLGHYVAAMAVREDGLVAIASGSRIGYVRPDYGVESWVEIGHSITDIAFVPGVVTDADGDTMPLWWEEAFALDPTSNADTTLDADGDGLVNLAEFHRRTNPRLSDTDGDGASDALEVTSGSDPRDPDSDDDGLLDGVELIDLGSNPLSIDSDGDGMGDLYEFKQGLNLIVNDAALDPDADGLGNFVEFELGTLPNVADSDGDGLQDGAEVNTHGTDPLATDSDEDGLSDGAEVNVHQTNPLANDSDADGLGDMTEVVTLGSNPNHGDTDGDAMPDAWEHACGLNLLVADAAGDLDNDGLANLAELGAGTRPDIDDTDRDSLLDGDEVAAGTNPLHRDSDGDRVPDGWEVAYAYDPLAADGGVDRDLDGFSALEEFWWGSHPEQASDYPRAAPWSTYQGDAGHRGFQPLKLRLGPGAISLRLSVETPQTLHPVVADADRIYYATPSARSVRAVDARTGALVWQQDFPNVFSVNPPAIAGGRIYVQTGNHYSDTYLNALDAATGDFVFRAPHAAQWEQYQAPTIFGNSVYVNGGSYGGAYAFDRITGAQQWFAPLPQYDRWTPAVDLDHVYAYVGGYLSVNDRATGADLGTIATPAPVSGWTYHTMSPLLGAHGNALVCNSSQVISFDIAARAFHWIRQGCDGRRIAVANGVVYAGLNGTLTAIDEIDGEVLWIKTFPSSLAGNLIVTREHVIVSDALKTHFVRLKDRSISLSVPGSGEKTLTEDGRMLIASQGVIRVYATRPADSSHLFGDSFE